MAHADPLVLARVELAVVTEKPSVTGTRGYRAIQQVFNDTRTPQFDIPQHEVPVANIGVSMFFASGSGPGAVRSETNLDDRPE